MGYSSTAIADFTVKAMIQVLQKSGPCPQNTSNGWTKGNRRYFYEIGRENRDGAITGTVVEILNNSSRNAGSFCVRADGRIVRWPTSTKQQRNDAEQQGQTEYNRCYCSP